MRKELWLRIEARQERYNKDRWRFHSAQVLTNKPSLGINQIAVKLELSIPDALFNRPSYTLKLDVPEPKGPAPVIDAEACEELAIQLQEQLGVRVLIEQPEVAE